MNKVKYDTLRYALERIATAGPKWDSLDLADIAKTALRDADGIIEYKINARTWYGRNGGEYKAELIRPDTGETVIIVAGTTWGNDAWAYDMRDKMHALRPDLFSSPEGRNPTIYFRDVCNVDYEHTEVARKKEL